MRRYFSFFIFFHRPRLNILRNGRNVFARLFSSFAITRAIRYAQTFYSFVVQDRLEQPVPDETVIFCRTLRRQSNNSFWFLDTSTVLNVLHLFIDREDWLSSKDVIHATRAFGSAFKSIKSRLIKRSKPSLFILVVPTGFLSVYMLNIIIILFELSEEICVAYMITVTILGLRVISLRLSP